MQTDGDLLRHPFAPLYNVNSTLLILGSFPSIASRSGEFYYANPRNRFWKVMAHVLSRDLPDDNESRAAMLLDGGIALWDVVAACSIDGSLDSNMRDITINDISVIFENASIAYVFLNGALAHSLYERHCKQKFSAKAIRLSSTSPANAGIGLEALKNEWAGAIRPALRRVSDEEID